MKDSKSRSDSLGPSAHRQKEETLDYFEGAAEAWRRKAQNAESGSVHLIAQRNACVLRVAEQMDDAHKALDIGCGTGELILKLAARGLEAVGVDFAEEMIRLCEESRRELNAEKASFVHAPIFDYEAPEGAFDLISALGLIEYISIGELDTLLDKCRDWLRPDGRLVLGSRNRLFNLISLNAYTRMEMDMGSVEALLAEAVAIAEAPSTDEALKAAAASGTDLAAPEHHPVTGINVATRHQYTPGELVRTFARHGFEAEGLFSAHYHALPPAVAETAPQLHSDVANFLFDTASEDHRLVPSSSTFVISARKA